MQKYLDLLKYKKYTSAFIIAAIISMTVFMIKQQIFYFIVGLAMIVASYISNYYSNLITAYNIALKNIAAQTIALAKKYYQDTNCNEITIMPQECTRIKQQDIDNMINIYLDEAVKEIVRNKKRN